MLRAAIVASCGLCATALGQVYLYNNFDFGASAAPGSGFSPRAVSASGVAAPAGQFWRECPTDGFDPPLGKANGAAGFNFSGAAFRIADDFAVPTDQRWSLTNLDVYAYQSGAGTVASTITSVTIRIWNGRPGDAGSTVIFGDTTTNRLSTAAFTGMYSIFPTSHACSVFPEATRPIFRVRAQIPALSLPKGRYWVDVATTGTLFSGPWCPTQVYGPTTRAQAWENAVTLQVSTGAWTPVVDSGTPTDLGVCQPAGAFVGQSMPFELLGTATAVGCVPDLTFTATPGSPGYGIPDGVLDNNDFFYFLSKFAAGDKAVADLTTTAIVGSVGYGVPNGQLTNDDFFYYLSKFGAGC